MKILLFGVFAALLCTASPAFAQPADRQILEACAQNRADRLPNPYTDLSPEHWAYRAVLSMHYCGAYRGAIPPEQIEQLRRSPTNRSNS